MARMRPIVHTEKHIVQSSLFTVAAGAITSIKIVDAVAVADKNLNREVVEGARVSAVYIEYWFTTNDTSVGSMIAIVEKTVSNSTSATTSEIASLDSYGNKKNVLLTFQGLTNPQGGVANPVFRQWLKIPKSKQRFGLGDKIVVSIFSQTGTLEACGFALFKEQQ